MTNWSVGQIDWDACETTSPFFFISFPTKMEKVEIFRDFECKVLFESLESLASCSQNQTISLTCKSSKITAFSCSPLGIQVSHQLERSGCRPVYYLGDQIYYMRDACVGNSFTSQTRTLIQSPQTKVDLTWLTLLSNKIHLI